MNEEFYQISKEIHFLWQQFIDADVEKEYVAGKSQQFKHLGYIICLMQIIVVIGDFAQLFKENAFPQHKLIFLLLLLSLAVIVFVLLHFKSQWFNYTYTIYSVIYITLIGWYMYDPNLSPTTDANNLKNNLVETKFVFASFVTLGLSGSNYAVRVVLYLYACGVTYGTLTVRYGSDFSLLIRMVLISLLFLYVMRQREHEDRRAFLRVKQIEQYTNLINNQIPHGLFAAKFNSNEQRIELFKCNSRAQQQFSINCNEDFDRFITHTYLAPPAHDLEVPPLGSIHGQHHVFQHQQIDSNEYNHKETLQPLHSQTGEGTGGGGAGGGGGGSGGGGGGSGGGGGGGGSGGGARVSRVSQGNSHFGGGGNGNSLPNQQTWENSLKGQIRQLIDQKLHGAHEDTSAIYKLQLCMQEGVGSENRISVRLNIQKLQECYLIITVDQWKEKRSKSQSKQTQQRVKNYQQQQQQQLLASQSNRQSIDYRRTTNFQENLQTISHILNPSDIVSPLRRLHAPSLPNLIQSQIGTPPPLTFIPEHSGSSPPPSVQQQQYLNKFFMEDEENRPKKPSFFQQQAIATSASYIPGQAACVGGSQSQLQPPSGIQKMNSISGSGLSSSKRALMMPLTHQQQSRKTVGASTYSMVNNSVLVSSIVQPLHDGIASKLSKMRSCSNSMSSQITAKESPLQAAEMGNPPTVTVKLVPAAIAQPPVNNQNHQEVFFEIVETTFTLCRQFNQNYQKFLTDESVKKVVLAAILPQSKQTASSYEAFEMYAASVIKQIMITHSNLVKLYRMRLSGQIPFVQCESFNAENVLQHIRSHLTPLLVDRSIKLFLQDDFNESIYSDQNALTLILINIVYVSAQHLPVNSFVGVRFSSTTTTDRNAETQRTSHSRQSASSLLKIVVSVPAVAVQKQQHPLLLAEVYLNALHGENNGGGGQQMKWPIELKMAFGLIRRLNSQAASPAEYFQMHRGQNSADHLYMSFTIPQQRPSEVAAADSIIVNSERSYRPASPDRGAMLQTLSGFGTENSPRCSSGGRGHFTLLHSQRDTPYQREMQENQKTEEGQLSDSASDQQSREDNLDDSITSVQRWVAHKQYTSTIGKNEIKFINQIQKRM